MVGRDSVLLVVSIHGASRRASPAYGPRQKRGYSLGGVTWSPAGDELFEMPDVRTPPGFEYDHDHCLDVWSVRRGYRRLWCMTGYPLRFRFHFDTLVRAPDGERGILNNGTVVASDGRVLGRLRLEGASPAFGSEWAESRLPPGIASPSESPRQCTKTNTTALLAVTRCSAVQSPGARAIARRAGS
jgi:hypothetical protein